VYRRPSGKIPEKGRDDGKILVFFDRGLKLFVQFFYQRF